MWVVGLMMIQRNLQRMMATYRIYGWRPIFLVIPRMLYGNVLNCHALLRAYRLYFSTPKKENAPRQPAWDKTTHDFPGCHPLIQHYPRLGDLLINAGYINEKQLNHALKLREKTGERLGEILCRLQYLETKALLQLLAIQYDLKRTPLSHCQTMMKLHRLDVPKKVAQFLQKNKVYIMSIHPTYKEITLAIEDPTNILLINQLLCLFKGHQTQFMLIDPTLG